MNFNFTNYLYSTECLSLLFVQIDIVVKLNVNRIVPLRDSLGDFLKRDSY